MSLNFRKVKIFQFFGTKLLVKEFDEIFSKVFEDKLLLCKLGSLNLSPPITNLFDFWFQVDGLTLQKQTILDKVG
jgi:hypothetical protein